MSDIEYLTSKTSYLLQKSEIGKVRPSTRQLPSTDFTYGKSSGNDKDGAKELLTSWSFHNPTKDIVPERNFKKLNKMTLKEGFHTSKHFSRYRKNQDIRLNVYKGDVAIQYELPEDEFIYGAPNRPSTPIFSVLANEYGTQSELISKEIYQNRLMNESRRTKFFPKITKSVKLNGSVTAKKIQEIDNVNAKKGLFKMTKFQRVPNKVDTINTNYLEIIKSRGRASSVADNYTDKEVA